MNLGYVIRQFENHSVAVVGMKGCGKDMLMGNVIVRRKLPYVSNTDYGHVSKLRRVLDIIRRTKRPNMLIRFPLDLKAINAGDNTYLSFLKHNLAPFCFPYPDSTDIYIADAGVYFPSQYCGELNRDFKQIPVFEALSRQLGDCRVHYNCQNLNRVWDKIREHCDVYFLCRWCKVFFKGKLVIQLITEYSKAESCQARINPARVRVPLVGSQEARLRAQTYLDNFYNQHGRVRNRLLIYFNRAKYDTRLFKQKLEAGRDD